MAAEYAPGMFCDRSPKQAADFAKVELRRGDDSHFVSIGIDVTKHGDHLLGELPPVRGGIQAKKASIQG
ncbi:MAG TPA: hypothetical protein VNX26_16965 [Candidatus Acidoferrum sp.]|nr:hypothetical protein [Candidatus Acidoferrum sp.]